MSLCYFFIVQTSFILYNLLKVITLISNYVYDPKHRNVLFRPYFLKIILFKLSTNFWRMRFCCCIKRQAALFYFQQNLQTLKKYFIERIYRKIFYVTSSLVHKKHTCPYDPIPSSINELLNLFETLTNGNLFEIKHY